MTKEVDKTTGETNSEKTEILYNIDEIVKRTLNDFRKIKQQLDNCTDSTGPSVFFNTPVWDEYVNLKDRGVKLRFITEITKENIHYCKDLMEVTELRHLDGVKGNFGIADGKDYGGSASVKEGHPPVELIRSNVKTFVDQQQFLFETLWSKSIPAEHKIKEIEEGIETIKTKVLENKEEIYNHFVKVIESSSERYLCSSIGGMQMVYNNFFNLYKKIIERKKSGEGNGIKWLTYIDNNKDNIEIVKAFLDAGIHVRHIINLPSMNFSVDSKSLQATIEPMDKGRMISSLLVSNEPAYVNHFLSFFQRLWENYGIEAEERIKNLEEGIDHDIEVIRHSDRTWELYLDIIKSSQNEIFFIFPTPKAFIRQLRAIFLAKLVSRDRKAKVRILTPSNEVVEESIKSLLEDTEKEENDKEKEKVKADENTEEKKRLESEFDFSFSVDIKIRSIEKMSNTKATIVVIDRKHFLVMELRDDAKDNFVEAVGQSIYSTSKAGVLSYVAIFENLWKQSELYHELKETNVNLVKANEQLKINDKMQKEFIDTAAHELRTPIQPILSLSYLLVNKIKDEKQLEMLKIIYKNAKKLTSLTKDILDVTKIEGNKLVLNNSAFNIIELLQSIITEFEQSLEYTKKIKFVLNINNINSTAMVIVFADRNRISEVISNLINNSIKFISIEDKIKQEKEDEENGDGKIIINVETIKTNYDSNGHYLGKGVDDVIVISIKDNGQGIDLDIFPRLFTKFVSKSFQGTGLGLFISKNIVEAHGGRIWAKNNEDEKGATFSFSLPLASN